MAVTLNNPKHDLLGLSTDTKPTTQIYKNTLFLELDTAKFYYYTGTSWVEVGQSESNRSVKKK